MTLFLDPTQRLNLHALMGQQRATVDELRLWWRLQDKIDLNDQERKAINYRVGQINGFDQPMWDVGKGQAHEFDFSDDDIKRIEKLIREWQPGYFAGNDRRWLEPLLAQLQPEKDHALTEAPVHAGHRA